MDDTTLGKGMQALQWEANYRKKKTDSSVANQFLVPQTSLDPDFERHFDDLKITGGKLLDIGTGTGEQAIFLAQKGFDVTATDVSPSAIKDAKVLSEAASVAVAFVEDNILLSHLADQFDLITDRGCFTLIPDKYKPEYVAAINKLLKPGGWLFLKADKKKNDLLKLFKEDGSFEEYASAESTYQSLNDKVVKAIVMVARKLPG
jgi:2-polyprenyl-3-methyl-5-hydroxy-6-metoxy-1,4-benzoquinol methylase